MQRFLDPGRLRRRSESWSPGAGFPTSPMVPLSGSPCLFLLGRMGLVRRLEIPVDGNGGSFTRAAKDLNLVLSPKCSGAVAPFRAGLCKRSVSGCRTKCRFPAGGHGN